MLLEQQLRVPCSPDEVTPKGTHKHLCECGTSWKHEGIELQLECTPEQFALAHSCPNCGNEVREKHYVPGDKKTIDDPAMMLLAMILGIDPDEDEDC